MNVSARRTGQSVAAGAAHFDGRSRRSSPPDWRSRRGGLLSHQYIYAQCLLSGGMRHDCPCACASTGVFVSDLSVLSAPPPVLGGRTSELGYFVPSYDVSSNRRILIADAMVSDFHVSTIIDT